MNEHQIINHILRRASKEPEPYGWLASTAEHECEWLALAIPETLEGYQSGDPLKSARSLLQDREWWIARALIIAGIPKPGNAYRP